MKVCSVESMRAMDKTAIEQYSIADSLLMENAALAVCSAVQKETGISGLTFAVICGTGNNGGDGFAAARKLLSYNARVHVAVAGNIDSIQGAARDNFNRIKRLNIPWTSVSSADDISSVLLEADVIIDAIFGTGLHREVTGLYREIINRINASGLPVVSVDIPSGIHGNTGKIMGTAVLADCTVSFGLPKFGNILYPGFEACGTLYVSHISFPPELYTRDSIKAQINVPPPVPMRTPMGHKGTFGNILVVAGARSYYGAPLFAAMSAYRAGAGYVRLAAPDFMVPHIAGQGPEIVCIPMAPTREGSIAETNRSHLEQYAAACDCAVIGPGLSLCEETQALVRELAARLDCFLIIDGDGLTALKNNLDIVKKRTAPTVLTPHAGELSRLTGVTIQEVLDDPVSGVQQLAEASGCYVVLKGAHSLICSSGMNIWINPTGNSGMATAGSGDSLTGTVGAMFGQGLDPLGAVQAGVFIHGLAGDLAADKHGIHGMTASTIVEALAEAMEIYTEQYKELTDSLYSTLTVI